MALATSAGAFLRAPAFQRRETTPRRTWGAPLAGVVLAAALAILPASTRAQATQAQPVVLQAMQQELTRSMASLSGRPTPPYFLSYQITDARSVTVDGAYGTVTSSSDSHQRILNLDLRVGSPEFDNTHALGGFRMPGFFAGGRSIQIPTEDNALGIRHALWYATDRAYKSAIETLASDRAGAQIQIAPEDSSADFANAPAVHFVDRPITLTVDHADWERRVRAYSAAFAEHDDVFGGEAHLSVEGQTRWYVNSDGSSLQTSAAYYRLLLYAYTKAADGMVLPRYESFVALSPGGLPADSTVSRTVQQMIADLHALKSAPVVDAYTGPAILSGRAAGVFFHEVFGHRIEGHRLKEEADAQTFKKQVGQQLLPDAFTVYSDPTHRWLGSTELAGYYLYDDEGVKARRVDVVRNGTFVNFLMSRSPIAGFSQSNGHGRSQPGFAPVARQSNLIVTSAAPVSRADLKRMLIDEINRQHKPFGLIFDDIEGGFTTTSRFAPNTFDVIPIMVRRVFPDGREELVRGIDLIGTPLTVFSKIVAADNETSAFNGVCGAESGWVPVSAASPDLLISQIEVQRKAKSQSQPPILPAPPAPVQ